MNIGPKFVIENQPVAFVSVLKSAIQSANQFANLIVRNLTSILYDEIDSHTKKM